MLPHKEWAWKLELMIFFLAGATVNGGRSADIALTVGGSDWYWAVCAIMTVATLTFAGLAQTKPRQGDYTRLNLMPRQALTGS
jgi:bacteriorhodopsin